jgi:hypothetical protein
MRHIVSLASTRFDGRGERRFDGSSRRQRWRGAIGRAQSNRQFRPRRIYKLYRLIHPSGKPCQQGVAPNLRAAKARRGRRQSISTRLLSLFVKQIHISLRSIDKQEGRASEDALTKNSRLFIIMTDASGIL